METEIALRAFTALGHAGRLSVFRLLMRHMPLGARPTDIAAALSMKPNTLSHHLSDLGSAGLIRSVRDGRSLIYSADLDGLTRLFAFLGKDCGLGRADLFASALPPLMEPDMTRKTYNVLFICSGNSARSIFAEAVLRDLGEDRFTAYSAGTTPGSSLNPFALDVLQRNDHATEGLRSKHVSEFQTPEAPVMDFVFTVCDQSANEECPPWPGQPISGHWGLPDPVKAEGTDAEKALVFAQTYGALRRRIAAFTALPFEQLDRIALQRRVDDIALDRT